VEEPAEFAGQQQYLTAFQLLTSLRVYSKTERTFKLEQASKQLNSSFKMLAKMVMLPSREDLIIGV
jgi:hypothetical protein